jgi:hypothetical protein
MISAFERLGNTYEPVRIYASRTYKQPVTYVHTLLCTVIRQVITYNCLEPLGLTFPLTGKEIIT